MIGIYCWENLINEKKYVGQSKNISKRKGEHIRKNKNKEYTTNLAKAFRKYGEENFSFSVLEECDVNRLDEREEYWIAKYNTLDGRFGYNMEAVGNVPDSTGSLNGRSRLNEDDVLYIRRQVYINNIPSIEVYQQFKDIVSFDAYEKAKRGETWTHVDASMIKEVKVQRLGKPKAKLNKDDVISIRQRYDSGEKITSIFNDYSHRVSRKTIARVAKRETWKNI